MLAGDGPEVRVVARPDALNQQEEAHNMTSQSSLSGSAVAQKPTTPTIVLLTTKEAAKLLKVSLSWLAKARMRGDGPPYIKVGRSIRYWEAGVLQWMKSRQRLSTSEQ
jgi:predicted DNA-binding transcriptional regulator AlpA